MSFADQWKKAGEPRDDFDPPNGSYNVKVIDASAFAGRDGREWAKAVLEIVGGEHTGRQFDHFMNLNNDVGLRIAYEALALYGMNGGSTIESLDDLSQAMFDLIGTNADVTVSHKDGFRNTNVQGSRTGKSDIPADDSPAQQQSFAAAANTTGGADDNDPPPF
jgi:hypothetical protein